MGLTINVEPGLEHRIRNASARVGLSMDTYACQILEREVPHVSDLPTGPELVETWSREGLIGIWASRTDIVDSAEYARSLRKIAEKRIRD